MTTLIDPNSTFNGFMRIAREIWEMTSDEYIESIDPSEDIGEKNLDFERPEQDVFQFTGEANPYDSMELIGREQLGNNSVNFYKKTKEYGVLLIAISNNNILGYMGAVEKDDKNLVVKTLFVYPQYRKARIGTKLFDLLTQIDPNPGTEELSAGGMALRKQYHKKIVEEAIQNGMHVPEKVLQEYDYI